MGKIVKFCAKCEEGFAAKFGFCPNCGESLQTFEMNPVSEPIQSEAEVENIKTESVLSETLPPAREASAETAAFSDADVIELDSADVPEEKTYTAQPASAATASSDYFFDGENEPEYDDDYRPTVIEDKDTQLRNGLLVSFASLVVSATMIAWVISIFVHALPVSALNEEELFAYVGAIEDKPMDREEEKKKDDDGGGGGGGGKERERDASKGDLPNQTRDPANVTPMMQMDADLKVINNTTGPQTNRVLTQPTGIPNSLYGDISSGRGSGGGMGGGTGGGIGGGKGDGEGPGEGGGRGGGSGGGAGGGTGGGGDDPPDIKKGVTKGVIITYKQQAKYTDAARQNNVQGSVTLRVTFTASGTIGAISAVNGLPYGLTEQAIAAARSIRFEPAMRNGQKITTAKTVTFSFTIY